MTNYTEVMREFNRLMKKVGKAKRPEEAQPLIEQAHEHLEQYSGLFPIEHNRHTLVQRALLDTKEHIEAFPMSYHILRADTLCLRGHEDEAIDHYEIALEMAQKQFEEEGGEDLDRRIRQLDKKIHDLKGRE